ncbi:sentrin-specific protease [Coprinopsis cinerea AmutBmut pab1-1]|nr:sentrin-specific protease [Coprinopsis cinerea AmutBmut pab1-1]
MTYTEVCRGCDIQVATDANFSQRHLRSVGTCSKIFKRQRLIPKEEVDRVGELIERARNGERKEREPEVPDEAIDNCQSTHEAGDGSKAKTNSDHFDDTGMAALICRHDIPIFIVNIDTPGEQHKYALAMVTRLLTLLPSNATVGVFYDVGCVVDRSLKQVRNVELALPCMSEHQQYEILLKDVTDRLRWATSAMHAYAHQWSCQLVYNPRMVKGAGTFDGEGVERYWSGSRKLIPLTRMALGERRLFYLELHAAATAAKLHEELGMWIRRRLKDGIPSHEEEAEKCLAGCNYSETQLREQWELQKQAQLSVRAHAPQRLKKELDTVLRLHRNMDMVDNCLEDARATLGSAKGSDVNKTIEALEDMNGRLKAKAEQLYASLNVAEMFPQLEGIDLAFVQKLLLLRDLKINIRKRAVGNFFEWERLHQAAGGRHQALGTMSKRTPALLGDIRLFNRYCTELKEIYKKEWNLPLPSPLTENLVTLRDDPTLYEDVWITVSPEGIPPWLGDPAVREGIRGLHRRDRAQEERRRIGVEADNMCRWFGRELKALDHAISDPANSHLQEVLHLWRDAHLQLKHRWRTSLVSDVRYQSHIDSSTLGGHPRFTFLPPATIPAQANQAKPQVPNDLEHSLPPSSHGPDTAGLGAAVEDSDEEPEELDDDEHANEDANLPHDSSNPLRAPDPIELLVLDTLVRGEADDTLEDAPSSAHDYTPPVTLEWHAPAAPLRDQLLLSDFRYPPQRKALQSLDPRGVYLHEQSRPSFVFGRREIDMLSGPNCLNDECMNGLAAHFYHSIVPDLSFGDFNCAPECALFSSHDLLMVKARYTDGDFWRRTKGTSYWCKALWILPIHRPDEHHWVLAVVYPRERRVVLFDSLGRRRGWDHDLQLIMKFVCRLVIASNAHGFPLPIVVEEGWSASPVTLSPLQSNSYDCGVWTLACIASLLRGFHLPAITENEVHLFRHILLQHVLALPVV